MLATQEKKYTIPFGDGPISEEGEELVGLYREFSQDDLWGYAAACVEETLGTFVTIPAAEAYQKIENSFCELADLGQMMPLSWGANLKKAIYYRAMIILKVRLRNLSI